MPGITEAVSIRRGLSLYKQPVGPGRGSPYWYARVYLPLGGRSIHTKSTGTTDLRAARAQAEDFWLDCKIKQKNGVQLPASGHRRNPDDGSFDHVAERWLDAKKADAGSDVRKSRSWKDDWSAYSAGNGLGAFFGRTNVRDITTDQIREFLRFQVEGSVKPTLAVSTQKRALVTLRGILKSAYERRLLDAIPLMPKLKLVDNPRPYFTRPQYRRLYITAWLKARAARARGDQVEFLHWMEMADFVIFMVSTFLRPSEWKGIRFCDVQVHAGGNTPHIRIKNVVGKTGVRDVVSMPEAIRAFRRMEVRAGANREAYLFKADCLNRQTAVEKMRDSFERLLRAAKLLGTRHVTYSLRHSAIMFRLLEGDNISVLLLAKAAGTSVDQIERFYGSHLQVGMKVAELHSCKTTKVTASTAK